MRPAPPDRHHNMRSADFKLRVPVVSRHTDTSAAIEQDSLARGTEQYLNTVFKQVFFNVIIELVRLLRPEVADWAVDELQPRLNRALTDFFNLIRFETPSTLSSAPNSR